MAKKRKKASRSGASRKSARRAARKAKPRRKARPVKKAKPRAAKPAARKPVTAPRAPNDIGLITLHLDFTTHAQQEVKEFYTEKLGFRSFRHMPEFNYLNITAGPSSSMGFMPPMGEDSSQWMPPKEPNLYFVVKDVDAAYRTLTERGVQFVEPPKNMPWGHRVIQTRDPEGRMVWLATEIKR